MGVRGLGLDGPNRNSEGLLPRVIPQNLVVSTPLGLKVDTVLKQHSLRGAVEFCGITLSPAQGV